MSQYLPLTTNGYLPYWMLFVSTLAVGNSVQNLLTTKLTRQIYSRAPALVNPLHTRMFAVWTFTSAMIRIYAAYNLSFKPMYDLALISYFIALGHFALEFAVYRTAGIGPGLLSPFVVATTSIVWMVRQYDNYVKL